MSPSASRTAGGYTIIELLAVVVLLSLLSTFVTVRLTATSETVARRSNLAALHDIDARARLFARREGAFEMRILSEGRTVVLHSATSQHLITRVDLEGDATVSFEGHRPPEAILFDRFGGSIDYEIKLVHGEDEQTWHVCGETGRWIRSEEEEAR